MLEKCNLQRVIVVDDNDKKIGHYYQLLCKETGLKLVEAKTKAKLLKRVAAIEKLFAK